jgi:hypothetical protein
MAVKIIGRTMHPGNVSEMQRSWFALSWTACNLLELGEGALPEMPTQIGFI